MRLFLATFATIENFDKVKDDFNFLQAKWVEPASLHLTFRFIGDSMHAQDIISKLQNFSYEPIEGSLNTLGFFGKTPKILYAQVTDSRLYNLHHNLSLALDLHPLANFTPHVTFARIKKCDNPKKLLETMKNYENQTLGKLTRKLHLVNSHLTPQGAKYSILHTF